MTPPNKTYLSSGFSNWSDAANETLDPDAKIRQRIFTFYYGYYYEIYFALTMTICILGLVTNILNMIVLSRKEMRNSTNFLLTALAVSDILVILARFPKTVMYYYFYSSVNEFVSVFSYVFVNGGCCLQYLSVIISNWISVAIGIWRFIAVTWPLRSNKLCSTNRAKIVVMIITVVSAMFCFPYLLMFTREKKMFEGKPIYFITPISYFGTSYGMFQSVYRAIIFFLLCIPVLILIGITAGLIRNMYKASKRRKQMSISKTILDYQTNRTTLMLTVMMIIFIVNNLPMLLQNIGYGFPVFSMRVLFIKHVNIFQFFFLLDNTSTFFTYIIMSRKFRRAFCRTFGCSSCFVKNALPLDRLRTMSTETTNTMVAASNEGTLNMTP